VIQFKFRRDLWRQKTRFPGLLCGIICVILSLAVLIQYRSVTDRQTDRHTHKQTHDDSIYHASIASCGKKAMQSQQGYGVSQILPPASLDCHRSHDERHAKVPRKQHRCRQQHWCNAYTCKTCIASLFERVRVLLHVVYL